MGYSNGTEAGAGDVTPGKQTVPPEVASPSPLSQPQAQTQSQVQLAQDAARALVLGGERAQAVRLCRSGGPLPPGKSCRAAGGVHDAASATPCLGGVPFFFAPDPELWASGLWGTAAARAQRLRLRREEATGGVGKSPHLFRHSARSAADKGVRGGVTTRGRGMRTHREGGTAVPERLSAPVRWPAARDMRRLGPWQAQHCPLKCCEGHGSARRGLTLPTPEPST